MPPCTGLRRAPTRCCSRANPARSGYRDGPASEALFSISSNAQVAADVNGNVYVSDSGRIRKISANGTVTTLAGDGTGSAARDGSGAAASFTTTNAIVAKSSGSLLVADDILVRRVSAGGTVITVYKSELGQYSRIESLALDSKGTLYVDGLGYVGRLEAVPPGAS